MQNRKEKIKFFFSFLTSEEREGLNPISPLERQNII